MLTFDVDKGGTTLCQGFIKAEWPHVSEFAAGRAQSWVRMFVRSTSLWDQPAPISAALRIAVQPGRPVTTVHSFVVRKPDESRLRRVLAALTRTEQLGTGSTVGPYTEDLMHDGFIHPGEPRVSLGREKLQMGGTRLFFVPDVRLADQLPTLLQVFADMGIPFAYELQAAPWTPAREILREFLTNVAAVAVNPGVPSRIASEQSALGERLARATWTVEECISSPLPEHAKDVFETVSRLLGRTVYSQFNAAPPVIALDDAAAQPFAYHVHSSVIQSLDSTSDVTELSAAVTREQVAHYLSCEPLGLAPELWESASPPAQPSGSNPPSTGGALSAPSSSPASKGPFLFASYARADKNEVYPIVQTLEQQGASIWIDQRLIAGDEWLEELEAQINRCDGVLAFLSPKFVESRYCCREVRYADVLAKKFIPVLLRPVKLAKGLEFIFHGIQQEMGPVSPDNARILSAVRAHAPETVRSH